MKLVRMGQVFSFNFQKWFFILNQHKSYIKVYKGGNCKFIKNESITVIILLKQKFRLFRNRNLLQNQSKEFKPKSQMIVLFVNAHKSSHEGKIRFNTYFNQVKKILKNTIYYGNEVQQLVKNKNELEEFIYDEFTYHCNPKAKEVFASLEYVFIDGDINTPPWAPNHEQLLLFIKCCIKGNKRIHCNGFGHFATYFYLSIVFDKPFFICSKDKITPENQKKVDYEHDAQTGDLSFRGKKVSNSGVKILADSIRPFSAKSRQAVNNGVVLPTKYHYVVFNSKNGQKILSNINFPFTFYWKGVLLCTPKSVSKAKANILVETEFGNPFAFTYKNCLSTQGLSSEFLLIIQNWLNESVGKLQESESKLAFDMFQTIMLDNRLNMQKTILKDQTKTLSRVGSSKMYTTKFKHEQNNFMVEKFIDSKFDKPMVRCGGKYETQDERYLATARLNKSKNLGRSRMIFKGTLGENQIKNFVNLTPSRPVSAYKFRQVNKTKWVDEKNFFLS